MSFNIPAQRADTALIEFAEQADRTLLYSYDLTVRFTAHTLIGQYTVLDGLSRLLEDTGLGVRVDDEGQIHIVEQPASWEYEEAQVSATTRADVTDQPGSPNVSTESGDSPVTQKYVPQNILENVLVTARKREESVMEVPASTTALAQPFLGDMGVLPDLRSLLDLIPGVTINDTNLAFITEPSIRGAGGGRNRMSVSATGLFRNGAYFATGGLGGKNFARMDNYDLERVEVLRGPQGALYGRNAMGGAINLISRRPQRDFGFEMTLRLGELDLFGVDARINVPISESFALRASLVTERRDDGFYSDVFGQPIDTMDYRHGRLSLRYRPSHELDINYVYDRQEETLPPGIRIRDSHLEDLGSEFITYANTPHEMDWDVENHNLTIDWKLGSGTLSSVTNLRDRYVAAHQDGDFWLPNPDRFREFLQRSDVSSIFFQEIRYASGNSGAVHWLVGADYFSSENDDLIDQTLGETWPSAQVRYTDLDQRSWAAFASVEYRFKSVPMTLSAEARYARDQIDGALTLYRHSDPDTPERDFTVSDQFTNIPMAATLSYRFESIDSMAWFKAASSYRQGGMNDGPGHPHALYEAELSYQDETSRTLEAGWKSQLLDGRLNLSFSGYTIAYDDFLAGTDNGCPDQCQLLDENGNPLGFDEDGNRIGEDENGEPIPPNEEIPRTAFMDNVGDAEAWGLEAEASYLQPLGSSGATLIFNFGWSRQMGQVQTLREDVSNALKVRALGARMQYMRPTQFKLQGVYRQPFSGLAQKRGFSGANLLASFNYVYEEGGFWSLDVNNQNPMATAKRLNARLGLETDSWSVTLNARNLTDENYRLWNDQRRTHYRRIDPRYLFVEFSYRYF